MGLYRVRLRGLRALGFKGLGFRTRMRLVPRDGSDPNPLTVYKRGTAPKSIIGALHPRHAAHGTGCRFRD